jgi:hypothetical protein
MASNIKSFDWFNHSIKEWKIYTDEFEEPIFRIALDDGRIKSFLISLSNAFYPDSSPGYELYDNVYNRLIKLESYKNIDLNIDENFYFTDLFSYNGFKWDTLNNKVQPTLIYSKRLSICFDPIEGISIFVYENLGITQFTRVSINEINILLFIMCKTKDIECIDITNIIPDNSNPVNLGLTIFSTVLKCCGIDEHLARTQCIIHPITDRSYLHKWGRYSFTMLTHVTEMTCRSMSEMLFYDYNIINALTQSKQLLLNRFQILAIKPVKPEVRQISSWFDFHIVLTISEPLINGTYSFTETQEGQTKINRDTQLLLLKLKDLPNELRAKVLGEPYNFSSYYCGYPNVEDDLSDCQADNLSGKWQSLNRTSFLFPISIRKRLNSLHSKMTDTYFIVRTMVNHEPFETMGRFSGSSFTTNERREKNASIKFISRNHFDGQIYDMNNEILKAPALHIGLRAPTDHDENREKRQDNPFFRKDSQFEGINMKCDCYD